MEKAAENSLLTHHCGICNSPVCWNQSVICCDSCDIWNHRACLEMSTTLFSNLAGTDESWICPMCEEPNFSITPMNSPVTTSDDDSYSNMSLSMRALSSSTASPTSLTSPTSPESTCSPGLPSAASSPHTQTQTPHNSTLKTSSTTSPHQTTTPVRRKKPVKDNMKLAMINCQSVRNKVQELDIFTELVEPDVIIGTESWLTPEIMNSEIFPQNYTIFRHDRLNRKGGGVFIMIRKPLICSEIQTTSNCEILAVEIHLQEQQNLQVIAFYRPPGTDDKYMEDFVNTMKALEKGKGNVWLGGDFNLPHINWKDNDILPGNVNSTQSRMLIDLADDLQLTQAVHIPTRENNILDLFFTSNPSLINKTITATPVFQK